MTVAPRPPPLLEQSRYRCCCNSIDVKTGTFIIGVLWSICIVVSIIFTIANGFSNVGVATAWILMIVAAVAGLVCLFIGLHKENGKLLLPFVAASGILLCIQILAIVVVSGLIIFAPEAASRIQTSVERPEEEKYNLKDMPVLLRLFAIFIVFLCYFIGWCISYWLIHAVWRCHKYFIEKKLIRNAGHIC